MALANKLRSYFRAIAKSNLKRSARIKVLFQRRRLEFHRSRLRFQRYRLEFQRFLEV